MFRLDGYLGELEEVITCTHMLQRGIGGLGEQFNIVQRAVRGGSLSIDDAEILIHQTISKQPMGRV